MRRFHVQLVVVVAAGSLVMGTAAGGSAATNGDRFRITRIANVYAAEPSVKVDPTSASGIHITTPAYGPTQVWSAATERGSYGAVATDGNGGDTDLALDGRGRLYEVEILDENGNSTLPVSVSRDDGVSFRRAASLVRPGQNFDRPWITAWGNGHVFVTALDLDASPGRYVGWRSDNAGRTWSAPRTIAANLLWGGPPIRTHDGALLVATGGVGAAVANRSTDDGRTWRRFQIAALGDTGWAHWPVFAEDAHHHLYAVWDREQTDPVVGVPLGCAVYLARSDDGGRHWTAPLKLSASDRTANAPWIVAGDDGRVDISYVAARQTLAGPDAGPDIGTPTTVWDVMMAQLTHADRRSPSLRTVTVAAAIHTGSDCVDGEMCLAPQQFGRGNFPSPFDRRLLEFFQIAADRHGNAVIAYPKDRPMTELQTQTGPSMDLYVAVQTSGPRLVG